MIDFWFGLKFLVSDLKKLPNVVSIRDIILLQNTTDFLKLIVERIKAYSIVTLNTYNLNFVDILYNFLFK